MRMEVLKNKRNKVIKKYVLMYIIVFIVQIIIRKYASGGGKGRLGTIYAVDWEDVIVQIPVILVTSFLFILMILEVERISKKNK